MDNIKKNFDAVKKKYDAGQSPLELIGQLSKICLDKLAECQEIDYNSLGDKHYYVLGDGDLSRPYRKDLLIMDGEAFLKAWNKLIDSKGDQCYGLEESEINKIIYTAVMAFAMCYDIYKNKSRKTPGTYFEIVLGSLISMILPMAYARTKFIPLTPDVTAKPEDVVQTLAELEEEAADNSGNVSTDIVFRVSEKRAIVIPAKTTTRERVVQPFAHQRILDSCFGEGAYVSLLCCVSETQRDDDQVKVNDICVPNTIKLFQRHLAKMGGIFYLDPPKRYLQLNGDNGLSVGTIGELLSSHLKKVANS